MSTYMQPTTVSQRAAALRSENRKLKQQLAAYQQYAPDPEAFALLVQQAETNERLYRACLARNVILNRKVREHG